MSPSTVAWITSVETFVMFFAVRLSSTLYVKKDVSVRSTMSALTSLS